MTKIHFITFLNTFKSQTRQTYVVKTGIDSSLQSSPGVGGAFISRDHNLVFRFNILRYSDSSN